MAWLKSHPVKAILLSMLVICVFGIGRDGVKLMYEKFFGGSKKEKEKEKKEKKEKKASSPHLIAKFSSFPGDFPMGVILRVFADLLFGGMCRRRKKRKRRRARKVAWIFSFFILFFFLWGLLLWIYVHHTPTLRVKMLNLDLSLKDRAEPEPGSSFPVFLARNAQSYVWDTFTYICCIPNVLSFV